MKFRPTLVVIIFIILIVLLLASTIECRYSESKHVCSNCGRILFKKTRSSKTTHYEIKKTPESEWIDTFIEPNHVHKWRLVYKNTHNMSLDGFGGRYLHLFGEIMASELPKKEKLELYYMVRNMKRLSSREWRKILEEIDKRVAENKPDAEKEP